MSLSRNSAWKAGIAVSALSIAALAAMPALSQQAPARRGPPGLSDMDKSNRATSNQSQKLRPHRTPPIAPALDKVPIARVKLPPGFKAEI